ncbi:MAG: hypothetical protein V3569_01965 [Acholeplasmataceae bacterium]|nr:DUF5011 domain-containing protein [Acholeplasmataceae bacterium]
MSFFVWLGFLFTSLSSNVIWSHTEIVVPLHGDFITALNEIEADLFIDGFHIDNAEVIYRIDGVERTFLSTINTSIVKTYTHKIEAYFPDYDIRKIMTISIKIIDDIPPIILSVPELKVRIGEKMPNLMNGFRASDNYDLEDLLKINIDTSKVIDTKIGIYPIVYQVEDLSGNKTSRMTWVEFYDDVPPQIILIKPLKHDVNHTFSWQTYFSVIDNYDTFLAVNVQSIVFEQRIIGIYPLKIIAVDQSGNEQIMMTTIEVIDQTPPILIISSERPDIPYQSKDISNILEQLVLKIEDNYDQLTTENIEILSSINTNVIGSYLVTYQVSDSSSNTTKIDISLKVTDQQKPTIIMIKPLVFNVFDPIPLFDEHLLIVDDFSVKENIKLEIIGSFHMDKVGKYLITIKAADEAKNQAVLATYLEVIDHTVPEIKLIQEILITQFKPINYRPYFEIKDQYDDSEDLKFLIDDFLVDYLNVGIYPLKVKVIDPSDHETTLIVDVMIMDIEPPKIKLKVNEVIDYPYRGLPIDYLSYVDQVSDNHDTLTKDDVIIIGEVDQYQFGLYQIIFVLKDMTGNETKETLEFIIVDYESPSITFDNLVVNQYETIDFFEGVHANDNTQNLKIIYYPQVVDTSNAGSVIVTYIVSDERGNYVIKDRLITILSVETFIPIKHFIPVITIIIIGLSTCIFIYFKEVKHMF